jgi:dihydroorotase
MEKMVEKMSHAVATCFQIKDRGFIREGYHADLVLVKKAPYKLTDNTDTMVVGSIRPLCAKPLKND